MAPREGEILEFGVFRGRSITTIANTMSGRTVYGFDSFIGLPEEWKRTNTSTYERGHFKTKLPHVPSNVKLVQGFFDDSLPVWIEEHQPKTIAFLHIDSDLYSSAKTVLTLLNDYIIPGTIIVFDELCDWSGKRVYDFWEEGEWKALHEWMDEYDREVSPISRTTKFAAAVKVIK